MEPENIPLEKEKWKQTTISPFFGFRVSFRGCNYVDRNMLPCVHVVCAFALARACFCRISFFPSINYIRVHRAWSPKFVGPQSKAFFFRIQILRCVGWIQHTWKVNMYIYIYTQLLWISISSYKLFIRIQLFFTTRFFGWSKSDLADELFQSGANLASIFEVRKPVSHWWCFICFST